MLRKILAVFVAAALAGCGGGGHDDQFEPAVVIVTDRPAAASMLSQALGEDVLAEARPQEAAAKRIRAGFAPSVHTVVIHYVSTAPTQMLAWRYHQDACDAVIAGGRNCVITTSASDPIDWATGKRSASWEAGGRLCDVSAANDGEAAKLLARCVRIARGEVL